VSRGVLAELGLPPGAVMHVYYNPLAPDGHGAAEAAAAMASVSVAGGNGGAGAGGAAAGAAAAKAAAAAGGAAALGALRRLDSALLRQAERSALVPEALKAWLRAGAAPGEAEGGGPGGAGAGGAGGLVPGAKHLQLLFPIGRVLWCARARAPLLPRPGRLVGREGGGRQQSEA
jgi:hypothetical protein